MDKKNDHIIIKEIFQFVNRACKTKKEVYLDSMKHKVKKKFKIEMQEIDSIFNEFLSKQYLLIQNGIIEINILANPIRKEIFLLIKKYPGIYFNLIKRLLNIGSNQVLWHLNALEKEEKINRIDFGKIRAYGLPDIPKNYITIGFLSFKNSSSKIFKYLCSNPHGPSQTEIMEYIQLSKSTTQYWIKKLNKLNLIHIEKELMDHHYLSDDLKQKICFTVKKFANILH